jgi:glycerol uptake facilitator-like aquaporin
MLTLTSLLPSHLVDQNFIIKPNLTSTNDEYNNQSSVIDFSKNIGLTLLNKDISPLQGYSIEFILTFILVFCIYACIDNKRKDLNGSFPLTIGFSVVVGSLLGVIIMILLLNK